MPGSSFAGAPRGTEQKAMHAEVHEDVSLSYGILKCLDPEVRWCGDIGAVTDSELGETPLGTATLWDFATRSAAAIIASRAVWLGFLAYGGMGTGGNPPWKGRIFGFLHGVPPPP